MPSQAQAPALTTVQDTVYKSDGSLASGSVVISWAPFVSADNKPVFGGTKTVPLTNGALQVALIPNAGATPAGTSYDVKYYQSGGVFFAETWVVPASSGPVGLAQVRVTAAPAQSSTISPSQVIGTAIVSSPTATQTITAPAASGVVPLRLRGNSSAAADVVEIYDSAGTPVLQGYFDSSAALHLLQPLNAKTISAVRFADQFPGAPADAKIAACIANLPSAGGVCDARGLEGAQTLAATVSIPAKVTLLLSPSATYTSSGTHFKITGNGGKLLGSLSGSQSATAASQSGTILRAASGYTSTTDMVQVANGVSVATDSIEIGGLVLDFADTTASHGRYGIYLQGVSNSWLHDIMIFDAGSHGVYVEASNVHSYDLTFDRIKVRVAGGDGFRFTTANGAADLDRITCNDCTYYGYNPGDATNRFGANGFHLVIPSGSAVTQGIVNFHCNNCASLGTANGGSGFFIEQAGSGYVANVRFFGELEDAFNANSGTGFNVSTAAAANLLGLDAIFAVANYSLGHNISSSNATAYTIRQSATGLNSAFRTDGIQFTDRAVSSGASTNTLKFYSSQGGNYSLGTGNDGILRYRRDDTNADIFYLYGASGALGYFSPAADSTGALGQANLRWANIYGVTGTISGAFSAGQNTVAFSQTPAFNSSTANSFKMTLTNNVTSSTISGGTAGQAITLLLCQDGTGSRAMTWPANLKLAGGGFTLTTTANKCDTLTALSDGSNWYEIQRATNE